jgi:DNA-binding NtrC family response regulator
MAKKETLLIVDDEKYSLDGLKEIMTQEGYKVFTALTAEDGAGHLKDTDIDLVITDLKLPGMDGLDFSLKILLEYPGTQVIIITAFGTVESAVKAMKEGVYNYITKPVDVDELLVLTKKALDESRMKREITDLKSKISAKYNMKNIIGASGPMVDVFEKVLKVAQSSSTILLRGESGTGKELVAHAIHEHSNRAKKPFVEIICSAFPDTLLESELFGYEKGAFTGANKTKLGRIEVAEGGTIFLDEIGDINPSVQMKLLRVLQAKTFTRLGSTKTKSADVRVIAATNSNLENSIKNGAFRKDLYYRLNVIPIMLPPLRKRKGDILLLVDHFIEKYAEQNGMKPVKISSDVLQILSNYKWPGNVRELENAIENAVVMCDKKSIETNDLPQYLHTRDFSGNDIPAVNFPEDELDYSKQLEISELQIIQKALEKTEFNKTKAAALLGISIRTMRYKVKKYNL